MKKLLLLSVVSLLVVFVYGQSISSSVVASAGGYSEAGGISLSWTLGELAVETFTTSELILTQGFQQGFYEITGIEEQLSTNFSVKVFPNPATEFIYILVENTDIEKIKIELFNMEGKLVYNKINENPSVSFQLNLKEHVSSQYILKITDLEGGLIQSYKIIKR